MKKTKKPLRSGWRSVVEGRYRLQPRVGINTAKRLKKWAVDHEMSLADAVELLLNTGMDHAPRTRWDNPEVIT